MSSTAIGSTPASASSGRQGVKLWYRQIDADTGLTLYDAPCYWYSWKSSGSSAEFGESNRPFVVDAIFQQDLASINADKWHVSPNGLQARCRIESFDTYNTTTTRSYRLVASAVRSGGSASMTFTAAANGIRGAASVTISNVVGMSATSFASALDAGLPHIVSITATGGDYPYNHINFEIEWETDDKHFSSYTFPASSSEDPVIRDLATGNITGVITTTTNLRSDRWQWLSETEIVGISSTVESFPNANPFFPNDTGACVQKMTVGSGILTSNWVSLPCEYRTTAIYPFGVKIGYARPAVRNETLIVTHTPGRGSDQSSGDWSTWHQLSTSDGSLTGNGRNEYRFPERFQFASDSQLFAQGVECMGTGTSGGLFQSEQRTNGVGDGHCELTSSLSGTTKTWEGSYGPTESDITLSFPICQSVADTNNIYWTWRAQPQGTSQNNEYPLLITPTTGADAYKLAFVTSRASRSTFISTSNPAWSSVFSFADGYNVIDYAFESPVNCRWNTDIEWRMVWTASNDNMTILEATDWLAFNASVTDWQTALDALWGTNYTGHQNCIVDTGDEFVPGSGFPLPLMAWERFPTMTMWSQTPDPITGQSPDFLADHTAARFGRIQLRSSEEFGWTQWSEQIGAMAWSDGSTVWKRSFGTQRKKFLATTKSAVFGIHTETQLICGGTEVTAELDPDRTDVGVAP